MWFLKLGHHLFLDSALSVAFWLHVQKVPSKGKANQHDRYLLLTLIGNILLKFYHYLIYVLCWMAHNICSL